MRKNAVAVGLKIPDNAAFTALRALQRLGVAVSRVERNVIVLDDGDEPSAFLARIERNQTLFNPNVHRAELLEKRKPRDGETWIEEIGPYAEHMRYMGWRLFDAADRPVARAVVATAAEALLSNPAIERALLPDESTA